jgi:hypothetical protein
MLYCNVGPPGCPGFPARGVFGMKWFRSNIKHGARFALFAFAVQLALSFGHFHGIEAQAAPSIQSAQQQPPASNHDSDQANDPCAICAVIALANTALFATPPVLLLPQAAEFPYLSTDAAFVHLDPASVAFQPRAPPLS